MTSFDNYNMAAMAGLKDYIKRVYCCQVWIMIEPIFLLA
jgi:hypothetical protein